MAKRTRIKWSSPDLTSRLTDKTGEYIAGVDPAMINKGILRTKLIKIEETREKKLLKCTRCGAAIMEDKVTWLTLSNTDGNYYPLDKLPEDHIMRGHSPFGRLCAFMQLHDQAISNKVDHIIIDHVEKTAICQHCGDVLTVPDNVTDNIFTSMSDVFIGEHKNCIK